ncbi:fluoride efflux transporter FluC [Leuconostoc fallax]|uniref:Fluoride-specific ion channel FluC n=1 Tax=Leuconostoc fallax TaxID=1251 RepID=A0A4R5N9L7_9LACO|nr:CrcB family protein [Leuconostoc fallax]MBU7455950.1 CrcB family protein [Leuconostoc fallax]MCO6184366.1 CrcB family protein [Leuconostoc fallax]TDG68794.1 hypothetical protein C5L23_000713 [Leuconostoc fallax]
MQKQSDFIIKLLIIGLGGAIGGSLRYLLQLIPHIGHWPIMITFINLLGTFCLAMLGEYLLLTDSRLSHWQSFIGTGVIGGFTTFSALILQSYELLMDEPEEAVLYLVMTIVGGMLMVVWGRLFARRIVNRT